MNAIPSNIYPLLNVKGRDLLDTLGLVLLREVVSGILTGKNVRSATEMLTRRRLSLISREVSTMFDNFRDAKIKPEDLYRMVLVEYFDKTVSKDAKIVLRWILGLTNKQIQNVMRSKERELEEYILDLLSSHLRILEIEDTSRSTETLSLSKSEEEALRELQLHTAIGAQSLAIRGSEKSLYGKFFEQLILGSVLSVLGFTLSDKQTSKEGSFWLSSTDKRESDATVIWKSGHAIRLDIGFIGVGNSEITLDKVSRFSKHIEISGKRFNVTTVIIVDRVGPNSSVFKQAAAINGHIVQMSNVMWVKELSEIFAERFRGYLPLPNEVIDKKYESQISSGVASAPLESIFKLAVTSASGLDTSPEEEV